MSDHESEVNPQYPEVESAVTGSFSTNGNDPGAYALASDVEGEERADGGTFLTDLAKAMQTTAAAEQARDAESTEQKRKAHLDAIRAREAIEAEDLRELAKDDVKGIDAWSDGEIKRIKLERERRIASRREQLQIRLEEHRGVVSREVDAVEAAVATYRTEIERFFFRLGSETDPVEIARQAGTRPTFPALEQIGPDDVPVATAYGAAAGYEAAPADTTPYEATAQAPVTDEAAHDAVSYTTSDETPVAEIASDPSAEEVQEEIAEYDALQQPEAAQADSEPQADPEPEPVVAEAEPVHAEGAAEESEVTLVGVMDPEAGSQPTETPWRPTEASAPEGDEQPVAENASSDEGSLVGASVGGSSTAEGSYEGQDAGSSNTAGAEGSEEPGPVAAEAHVVMPRSTGAGSWLRWPNGSTDRSDPGQ
jgi:hypothetical protein